MQTSLNLSLKFALIRPASTLLMLTVLAIAASAQETTNPPATAATIKVTSREVVLPVTVRDKKGQILPNLKSQDFTLLEDSRPQVIKSFQHDPAQPFRVGLLVDTSRSLEGGLPAERTASGKFIDDILAQPADKAFLLHFDHQVELLQDFTAKKDKLHHELDEMGPSAGGGDSGGSSGDSGGGRGRRGNGGTQMYDAIYLASNELMQKEPGRKALILLSDGADRGSKETLNNSIDAAEKANVSIYTVYFKGEEDHGNSPFNQGQRRGGGGGFPGGGGGYPGGGGGYPGGGGRGGGQRPSGGEQPKIDGKKIMEQIATRTGGRFFEAKKKDFDEIYAQIKEELRGQYLLTYTPDKASGGDSNDGFRKISLKPKDDKLTVVTREGYYAQD
jgi:VWFA-related protein